MMHLHAASAVLAWGEDSMKNTYETAMVLDQTRWPDSRLISGHRRHSDNTQWEGLGELRFSDLKEGIQLMDILAAKLNGLDDRRFTDRELERNVVCLVDLVRETVAGRYPDLSLRGLVQILAALDHFVEVRDEIPDTWVRGYEDDARHIEQVCHDLQKELETFARWRKRQPPTH